MVRVAIIFIIFFLPVTLRAQQAINYTAYIDSLEREFAVATNDSVKARRAFDLVSQWSYTDSVKTKFYLDKGRQLIGKNSFLNALYQYYYSVYMYDINTDSAMKSYMDAERKLQAFQTKEAFYFRARSWRNFGTLQQRKGEDKGFMTSISDHAIPLAVKSGDKELEGELYTLIGLVLMNEHIYYKAIEHYNKGISIVEKVNPSSPSLLDMYDNLTRAYIFSDSLPKAKAVLDKMKSWLKGMPESSYNLNLYDTESIYFRNAKNYSEAENSLDKGLQLAKKLNDSMRISSLQYNKYKLYFEQGKYNDAKNILQKVINGPGARLIGNKTMYFYEMSETYAKLNDMPNAYKWLKDFFVLWESSFVEKMRVNIIDVEGKYQKSQKENEILTLKNQQALQKQKVKTNTLIYLSVIGFLLSSVIIIYLQLRNKKRKEQLLQNEIRNMENEKKLSTYEALIDGQEKERNRLATELHDGLGGMLAAVKMNLSNTAKDVASINAIIESSTSKLDHSIQELRLIARNLMPPSLRQLGLVSALHDFCEGLKSQQVSIVFQSYDVRENEIDENTKLIIYRIFQELITNAIKHSGGNEILADLVQSGSQVQITVEDNGKGFQASGEKQNGIGLSNIKSRVDYLKGNMNIESNTTLGTTINISFNISETNG